MSLNPGPLTLGVLNARSIRNKGPLLADMVSSNDDDCLTFSPLRKPIFGPLIQTAFHGL